MAVIKSARHGCKNDDVKERDRRDACPTGTVWRPIILRKDDAINQSLNEIEARCQWAIAAAHSL
jgi:hypothetical protein